MASRVQQALARVARESEGDGDPPSVPQASVDPALRGVSEALLEKVPTSVHICTVLRGDHIIIGYRVGTREYHTLQGNGLQLQIFCILLRFVGRRLRGQKQR